MKTHSFVATFQARSIKYPSTLLSSAYFLTSRLVFLLGLEEILLLPELVLYLKPKATQS